MIGCNGWCCDEGKFEMVVEIIGIGLRLECGVVIRNWNL